MSAVSLTLVYPILIFQVLLTQKTFPCDSCWVAGTVAQPCEFIA